MRNRNKDGSFDHGEWGVFLLVSCLVERGSVGIFESVSASEGRFEVKASVHPYLVSCRRSRRRLLKCV